MLAATDLHSNHSIVASGVYTFGQPRVGNQAFALHFKVRKYRSRARSEPCPITMTLTYTQKTPFQEITTKTNTPYYRLVHAQDPVVHAPPVLLGFWHAPFEVFYNKVRVGVTSPLCSGWCVFGRCLFEHVSVLILTCR